MKIKITSDQTHQKSFLERIIESHGEKPKKSSDIKQETIENLSNVIQQTEPDYTKATIL